MTGLLLNTIGSSLISSNFAKRLINEEFCFLLQSSLKYRVDYALSKLISVNIFSNLPVLNF